MKKYTIIAIIAFLFCSCFGGRTPTTYTFDASKDTSFVISRTSLMAFRVVFNITGQLEDSSMLVISYFKNTPNAHNKYEFPLSPGVINWKNKPCDFFEDDAIFTFKHLKNKKGKLTIKASL